MQSGPFIDCTQSVNRWAMKTEGTSHHTSYYPYWDKTLNRKCSSLVIVLSWIFIVPTAPSKKVARNRKDSRYYSSELLITKTKPLGKRNETRLAKFSSFQLLDMKQIISPKRQGNITPSIKIWKHFILIEITQQLTPIWCSLIAAHFTSYLIRSFKRFTLCKKAFPKSTKCLQRAETIYKSCFGKWLICDVEKCSLMNSWCWISFSKHCIYCKTALLHLAPINYRNINHHVNWSMRVISNCCYD